MVELEAKTVDAKREMAVADALDEIRLRNAQLERSDGKEADAISMNKEEAATRLDEEDKAAAKRAFATHEKTRQETFDPSNMVTSIPLNGPKPSSRHSKISKRAKRKGPKQSQETFRRGKALGGIASLVDYNSDSS